MRNWLRVFLHCLNYRRILSGKHRHCTLYDNWRHETVHFCSCGYCEPDAWQDLLVRR